MIGRVLSVFSRLSIVLLFFCMAGCGGGGTSSAPSAKADPTAPSAPTGVTAKQVTSNFIAISWNASTGGNGGVDTYKVFRGHSDTTNSTTMQMVGATNNVTHFFEDYNLLPDTTYIYKIIATSLVGTKSQESIPLSIKTLSKLALLNKTTPYISFYTDTGKIYRQFNASPGVMAVASMAPDGRNIIPHQRVDSMLYKITPQGFGKYAVSDINTGIPIESPVYPPALATTSKNVSFYYYFSIDNPSGFGGNGSSMDSGYILSTVGDGCVAVLGKEIL